MQNYGIINSSLDNDKVVSFDTFSKLKKPLEVICPENATMVVENGKQLKLYYKIEDKIINPKSFSSSNNFNDFNCYFISGDKYNGKWGNNIKVLNEKGDNEKIYIRSSFDYQIYRPEKLIKLLNEKKSYTKREILDLLRDKFDNYYCGILIDILSNNSYKILNENLEYFNRLIENKITIDYLFDYGVEIKNNKLYIEKEVAKC